MPVETFKFEKEVPLVDADGIAISEGSVLREITDGDRGVVTCVVRPGSVHYVPLACTGDIQIETGPGTHRVTNRYSQWRHIPRSEQTYRERWYSWCKRPFLYDEDSGVSKDEALAMEGILALFPNDPVDWENGPWPNEAADALGLLARFLDQLAGTQNLPEIFLQIRTMQVGEHWIGCHLEMGISCIATDKGAAIQAVKDMILTHRKHKQ